MPILSHPAFGPRASLVYITLGSLIDIWVGVWYFVFARNDPEMSAVTAFWLIGLFLTGLLLLVIGLLLGRIGQAARRAELPPPEALPAEAAVQQAAPVVPGVAVPGVPAPGYPAGAVVPAPVAPVAPVAPAAPPTTMAGRR
jgi:hypothetical protein